MVIARAPLRVSFFGGGTDFPEYFLKNGGAVLATAIDKYSFVTASAFHSHLFDYAIRVSYRKNESVQRVEEIEHPVFRECLRFCGLEKDIELHAVADLPAFTGLGSSSTFTVSLLHALHTYKGEKVEPLQLAYEAIHIERHVLDECVGCQDQTIAAVGGFNVLEFRSETDIKVYPLNLRPDRLAELQAHLYVIYTGIKRRATEIEAMKIRSFAQNHRTLLEMRRMVDEGRDILSDGRPLEDFGNLLDRAWQAKRSLESAVSNGAIDDLYRQGREAGAWGGKLLGAGGGGFLLFMAPPDIHPRLGAVVRDKFSIGLTINCPGSEVIFQPQ